MLLKRQGLPSEEELVLCTVTGITPHSVFAVLDEYGKRTGLVHISEVAPGRIRNIRDFVKEGKKIVCKVLRTDLEKGHIDLSIRRVTETQQREKLNQVKEEQLAERILEQVAKQRGDDPEKFYDKIAPLVLKKYAGVFPCLTAVALDGISLEALGVDKVLAKQVTDAVKERIKPPEVAITGDMKLATYLPDGVLLIKQALSEGLSTKLPPKSAVKIAYAGAGNYHVTITAKEFKEAERVLKSVTERVTSAFKDHGSVDFVRKN